MKTQAQSADTTSCITAKPHQLESLKINSNKTKIIKKTVSHQHTSPKRKTLNPSLTIFSQFVEGFWFLIVRKIMVCEQGFALWTWTSGWSTNLNLLGRRCCHEVTFPGSMMKVDVAAWDGGCYQALVWTWTSGWSMNLNLVGRRCCHEVTLPGSMMKVDVAAWDGDCYQALLSATKSGGFRWQGFEQRWDFERRWGFEQRWGFDSEVFLSKFEKKRRIFWVIKILYF